MLAGVRAAWAGAWSGAVEAVRAARAARRAGTDWTTRCGRAVRTGVLALTAAGRAAITEIRTPREGATWRQRVHAAWLQGRQAFNGVRTTRAATRAATRATWAMPATQDVAPRPEARPEARPEPSAQPQTPGPVQPVPGEQDQQDPQDQQDQQDVTAGTAGTSGTDIDSTTDSTTTSTTTSTTASTTNGTVKGMTMGALTVSGDLETTEELRAEVVAAQGLLDEASDAVAQLVAWASMLPDRMDAAPWETAAVLARVAEISETLGTLQALDEVGESLTAMKPALDEADALGEHAAGIGAGGNVTAFAPA